MMLNGTVKVNTLAVMAASGESIQSFTIKVRTDLPGQGQDHISSPQPGGSHHGAPHHGAPGRLTGGPEQEEPCRQEKP